MNRVLTDLEILERRCSSNAKAIADMKNIVEAMRSEVAAMCADLMRVRFLLEQQIGMDEARKLIRYMPPKRLPISKPGPKAVVK